MLESLVLGIVQGITEWLPVSSEGSVTTLGSLLFGMTLEEAIGYALWLHVGTAISAIVAFRNVLWGHALEALADPLHPTPLARFVVIGTAVSVALGLPIILALENISDAIGAGVMIFVGVAMLGTAAALHMRREAGTRTQKDLNLVDAITYGLTQGLTVIPGFSRSGLTVALLLGRRFDRAEALAISFIMSIPASLGGAIFASYEGGGPNIQDGLLGAAVAAVSGLVSIKALLAVAHKVNFALFVAIVGVAVIGGGIAQVFF